MLRRDLQQKISDFNFLCLHKKRRVFEYLRIVFDTAGETHTLNVDGVKPMNKKKENGL